MAKLYIVPTPIGNLDDITLRAVNVLRTVDFILAEDTRTTSFLLKHLGIEKKLRSHHKFNEHATVELVAGEIAAGRDAALVSDAGTPGISDPGFLLVRTCVGAGIEVETLPGATAFVPALVQSGFPCDRFCFEGFLPQKKGRTKHLLALCCRRRSAKEPARGSPRWLSEPRPTASRPAPPSRCAPRASDACGHADRCRPCPQ